MKRLTIVLAAICLLSGCFNIAGDWHIVEHARLKSPDGLVDAVLVEGDAGATTSFTYAVFIVPSGTKFDEKSEWFESGQTLFTADKERNLQLVWREPKVLEVKFEKARIHNFRNFWSAQEVQNYDYKVELILVPLDKTSSLIH